MSEKHKKCAGVWIKLSKLSKFYFAIRKQKIQIGATKIK